ncbi:MAG: ABC transporter permease [Sphaerochaetaceae bacterium]|nr:ABC transporter permease [Sphaerochaetaceae bacterium]MDC7247050.1 ABC transporter permease [Sphaerochaetaceae bacterium]
MNKYKTIRNYLSNYGIFIVLLMLIIFFSFTSENFLNPLNIFNILRQVSIIGISAVGMTMVLLTGGIDLSVGSLIAVTGVGIAKLMLQGLHPVLASLIMLAVAVLIGLLNGFFINRLRIPPLITTLGMMTSLRGLAFIITGGLPVFGFNSNFAKLGQGYVWKIPIPVLVMLAVFVIGILLLAKTRFGRYVYGVGSNEEATRLSGINVQRVKYIVYAVNGLMAGLAGLILLSRINSGQPNAGQGYELEIITAVVLGGVSINGGEGRLGFVVIGVLIMGVLTNGMIMMNVNDYVQQFVKGLVLIAAVAFDRYNQTLKEVK